MSQSRVPAEIVAQGISRDAYLRARYEPHPGDASYLHLKDLRSAVARIASTAEIRVLDYGSGGSPYRPLFPNAHYFSADLPDTPAIDFVIQPDGRINAESGQFDLIISTQVLEHVATPSVYLRECLRLLKPGGRLYLTTHGFYEEHGCPYDFHRWTADGLRQEVESAGFRTSSLDKLTTNGRALLQLIEQHHAGLFAPRWHPFGLWLGLFRLLGRHPRWMHRWSDRFHAGYTVVSAAEPGHSFFIALGIVAEKPTA